MAEATIGPHRLMACLGAGGRGLVHLGRSDAGRTVAVKVVRSEYAPSLQAVVAQDFGPLPEASVRVLANGLAWALTDLHAAGLLHRDLKPHNAVVTVAGPRAIDNDSTGQPVMRSPAS